LAGTLIDGTGAEPYEADVAVKDGRVAEIGRVAGYGREEIDAKNLLVTPGFVDIHTHYDGQVTWANTLGPSSAHGVTTAVMGNCGVGFAPCRPDQHEQLITLMEGVEDIPGIVMAEGIPWNWETFEDYLDALDQRRTDIDFAMQVPHAPVRLYVVGKRGAAREPATASDIAQMTEIVRDGLAAGALGFSTSRTQLHRTMDGGFDADRDGRRRGTPNGSVAKLEFGR
jgi:N-acyl-D-amino-acid deacylase